MDHLTEEQKLLVEHQVAYFTQLMADRYRVEPDEILEAVKYVRDRKAFMERIKSTGLVSLIGLILSAVTLAVWEGMKSFVRGER